MTVGIAGIVEFMTELGFELSVVNAVVEALDESGLAVGEARKIDQVGHTSFGDLQESTDLAGHTQKARETVRSALEDMVTGLTSYRDTITGLVADSYQVEADTQSSFRRIEQAESCVTKPSFSAPSQCTPGSEG